MTSLCCTSKWVGAGLGRGCAAGAEVRARRTVIWRRPANLTDVLAWERLCMCAAAVMQLLMRHSLPAERSSEAARALTAFDEVTREGLQDLCARLEALRADEMARPSLAWSIVLMGRRWCSS